MSEASDGLLKGSNEPHHEETCLMSYANNKDTGQHPRSLISAFVVRCLDSIIPILAIYKISILARFCS